MAVHRDVPTRKGTYYLHVCSPHKLVWPRPRWLRDQSVGLNERVRVFIIFSRLGINQIMIIANLTYLFPRKNGFPCPYKRVGNIC